MKKPTDKPVKKDDKYLTDLLSELTSDPAYHTGERPFPRKIDADDALVIAGNLQAEVDRGVEARERLAAQRGVVIACTKGCSACCAHLVMVYEPEAVRIARWLSLPVNEEIKRGFLARYEEWREGSGDGPERMSDLTAAEKHDERLALHLDHFRKGVICAFNDSRGACTIYPVRPVACRHAHALNTPDNCRPSPKDGLPHVRNLHYLPLDEFVERAKLVERATHHAMGGETMRPRAVVQRVYELLTAT